MTEIKREWRRPELIELVKVGENEIVPGTYGETCQVLVNPNTQKYDFGDVGVKYNTLPQTLLQGEADEMFIRGEGIVVIVRIDGREEIYKYPENGVGRVLIGIFDSVQFISTSLKGIKTLERCTPPFEDGKTYLNHRNYECVKNPRRLDKYRPTDDK